MADSKVTWKVVKEFEEDGLLVQVSMSDTPRPRYTMRVCRRNREGMPLPFLQVFVEGQGAVRVKSVVDVVARLLDLAEEWVREEAQKHEDEYIARRIERETQGVTREGKKRRPSGYKHHGARSG